MFLPRISGVLNNCALNCGLPEIFLQIDKIANHNLKPNEAHVLLKKLYEEFYQIPEHIVLTWVDFNHLIKQNNFAENELIFAPIIRKFIGIQAYKQDSSFDVRIISEIIDDPYEQIPIELRPLCQTDEFSYLLEGAGRYYALTSHEANQYFYKSFGLSMGVYEFVNGKYLFQGSAFLSDNIYVPTYLKNGHYELQPHHLVSQTEPLNASLQLVYNYISFSSSKYDTHRALFNLQKYVHRLVISNAKLHNEQILNQNPLSCQKQDKTYISREELIESLNEYKTHFTLFHFILWIVSFGYHQARSATVVELDKLVKDPKKDFFSKDDIAQAINSPENNDSRKNDRYQFWTQGVQTTNSKTGTDELLSKLAMKFF